MIRNRQQAVPGRPDDFGDQDFQLIGVRHAFELNSRYAGILDAHITAAEDQAGRPGRRRRDASPTVVWGAPALSERRAHVCHTLCGVLAAPIVSALFAGCLPPARGNHRETPARGRQYTSGTAANCHGDRGDGAGEVARWARPRPRDFRQGVFKFRTTPYGSLPTTADLDRVIQDGLYGTLMPPSTRSTPGAPDVIAYLQCFSPRWRTEQPGTPVVVPDEPTPYHRVGHPRPGAVRRELFVLPRRRHGEWTSGGGMTDVWGTSLQPANLAVGRTKSARTTRDIYLRIMTGINGTPMPGFAGALKPDQAWQIAHYVEPLAPGPARVGS